MKDFDFKPDVLSLEYVKEHGTLYDGCVFYSDNEECEALFDKKPELGGKPFTGLLYELDMDAVYILFKGIYVVPYFAYN